MKRLSLNIFFLFGILFFIAGHINAQHLTQDFTLPLLSGNEGGGTIISNISVTADANYVSATPSNSQFTFLSTNGTSAKIEMNGTDGKMRLIRSANTVYVVRNANFEGPPGAVKVTFDFNTELTGGTSTSTIEFMLGQNFPNSNSAPSSANKHSLFFVNTKSPTGVQGAWGVSPTAASSASSYNTTQTITWVVNNSGETKQYIGPDGSTETVANDKYDLWVGNTKLYDEEAANSPDAQIQNFEIRIAGGNGTYTVDNLLIQNLPPLGTPPTVTTAAVTSVTQTSATTGGNVTDGGTSPVTARGVVWSTSPNPTTTDNKTEDGTGTGVFVSNLTGLTAATTYYVRAYAQSLAGTSYGSEVEFTTLSGAANIVLSSANPAVPSGNVTQGTNKNPIYKFNLAVTVANTQLNQVNFMTEGTYTSADVTKLQLWYNTADNFAEAVQIGSDLTAGLGGVANLSFGSLTQNINVGETGYLWITADVAENATAGRVISVDAVTTAGLTFSSGNKSGTAFGGGLQTIVQAGNPNVYFRTKNSGNWNALSTWESSLDSSAWSDALLTPNNLGKYIHIRNGHTVTVTDTVSVDQVIVDQGATILVNGSPVVFTIVNGPEDVDMLVNGTVKVTGTANVSPGPYSVNAEGTVVFGATGVYEHEQNAGAIPVSVWNTGSTLKLTGITANSPANGNQNFYNIIWDCPNQTANLNLGWNGNTIGGNISVVNTNAGRWQFCAPTAGNTSIVTIMGDVSLQAGNLTTNGTGNANTTIEIHHYGNINVTGGNFSISRGSQGNSGTSYWYLYNGHFNMSNATTQNSNPTGGRFVFTGSSTQNLNLSDITYTGGGLPVVVDSNATVALGMSVLGSTAPFTLMATGGIYTAQPTGFVANFQNTGTISLSQEGRFGYNGTTAQVTDAMLPATVNGLYVSNSAGVTLSSPLTVNGQLIINNGNLLLNGNTVTLGTDALLTENPGSTVTGSTGKIVTTRVLNAPNDVNVGGLGVGITSSANLGSTLVERMHSTAMGNGNSGINRIYNISPANNTGLNATLKLYYDESELNSIPEANLRAFRSTTGLNNSWNFTGGTPNTSGNYVQLTGVNEFSYWTLADINGPIPVELTSFTATSGTNGVTLNWSTASETNNQGFYIERSSDKNNWENLGFVQGNGTSVNVNNYLFVDRNVSSGTFHYRLKQSDFDGTFSYLNEIEVEVAKPDEFALHQNYPNPFNPTTKINFALQNNSYVELYVYDALGNQVAVLVNQSMEAGLHEVTFNASNLSSGIYYYTIRAGEFFETKKMMLIK